jgi:hypothetical protein
LWRRPKSWAEIDAEIVARRALEKAARKASRTPEEIERSRAHGRRLRLAKYGLTEVEFGRMQMEAGRFCRLCLVRPPEAIDHCHKTGRVRGLLCGGCNMAIGGFLDDPDTMRRAAAYLEGVGRSGG